VQELRRELLFQSIPQGASSYPGRHVMSANFIS
jgi:hypothetical protein